MPQEPAGLVLQITDGGDCVTVRLPGCTSLTEVNVEEIGRQLAGLIAVRDRLHLSLDLAGIDYLTSVALAKFLSLHAKLHSSGGRLSLVNLKPTIREVFTVTQLDRVLDVRGIDEAPPA
ncbi:MAG TPA: STAS domain-containing protein [Gemmataceae bacterium]|nr:STAS domain-containing protein [Gemmataceae bacterium]